MALIAFHWSDDEKTIIIMALNLHQRRLRAELHEFIQGNIPMGITLEDANDIKWYNNTVGKAHSRL